MNCVKKWTGFYKKHRFLTKKYPNITYVRVFFMIGLFIFLYLFHQQQKRLYRRAAKVALPRVGKDKSVRMRAFGACHANPYGADGFFRRSAVRPRTPTI